MGSCRAEITGGGRSFEEYIIHQIEMAVSLRGVGSTGVTVKNAGESVNIEITYPKSASVTLSYSDSNDFSVCGKTVESPFFENLIAAILRFFITAKAPFDTKETLEVIRIRDAVISQYSGGAVLA